MKNSQSKRYYTLLGYLLIAAFIALIGATIVGTARWIVVHDVPETVYGKWVALAVFTPITFWVAIKECLAHWAKCAFWVVTVAVLGVHIAFFTVLLFHVENWHMGLSALICVIEEPLIVRFISRMMASL
ncbi:MAG TPA: hypothetical protein VGR73_12940 [Bryobacteraceae bacterium]|nr:hypothetical protein [Bryobacteraceae bacterium]